MMIKKIKYYNVGRSKANGEFLFDYDETNPLEEENLEREIVRKVSRYLLSSDINVSNGTVFAGFRSVGTYEIIDN